MPGLSKISPVMIQGKLVVDAVTLNNKTTLTFNDGSTITFDSTGVSGGTDPGTGDLATKQEAIEGLSNSKLMTPLRTKEAFEALMALVNSGLVTVETGDVCRLRLGNFTILIGTGTVFSDGGNEAAASRHYLTIPIAPAFPTKCAGAFTTLIEEGGAIDGTAFAYVKSYTKDSVVFGVDSYHRTEKSYNFFWIIAGY